MKQKYTSAADVVKNWKHDFSRPKPTPEELKRWEEQAAREAANLSDESLDFDTMLAELERMGAIPPQSPAIPARATT